MNRQWPGTQWTFSVVGFQAGKPMPIYEYRCRACGAAFEALVRPPTPPACPSCQSEDLERLSSLFAVNSDTTRAMAVKAGRRQLKQLEQDTAAQRREVIEKHGH